MIYEPTGAIVAAPTTSLPESIGHNRNWDYRYTWIRDSAFMLYALLRIGFTHEAQRYVAFVEERCKDLPPEGSLQVLYGIRGERDPKEELLVHLKGYRGSRPVRIGNRAAGQQQLDIYGELMDAVYLSDRSAAPISYVFRQNLRRLLDWLGEHWQEPDASIWEVRGGPREFTYSRVMSWVAFDRAIRIALRRGLPSEFARWLQIRDQAYEAVLSRGWDARRRTFVQYFGGDALDASALLLPVVHFLAPSDPRVVSTLEAIEQSLVSDSLVYRYHGAEQVEGDLQGQEGTFCLCTFWLVECLTRVGRLEDARLVFEKMFTYANHLGLFAEEIGPSGEALGNFPQAFTHLSLITAAYNLNAAIEKPGHRGELRGMYVQDV
jgi:GH15 family glucan-1,4-alpha-glucosidase